MESVSTAYSTKGPRLSIGFDPTFLDEPTRHPSLTHLLGQFAILKCRCRLVHSRRIEARDVYPTEDTMTMRPIVVRPPSFLANLLRTGVTDRLIWVATVTVIEDGRDGRDESFACQASTMVK
jgi:hypothetical protein